MTHASPPPAPDPSASLSPIELLYGDFAGEFAVTRRFLERYPDGRGDWRPHERSRTLSQLATHVADIVNRGTAVLELDGIDVAASHPVQPRDSAAELMTHFDAGVARFTGVLATVDLDLLSQSWALRHGSRVLHAAPRRILLRQMMLNHLVHHRAQLGVYYRLLGIPVPGSYGPSADD